MADQHQQVDVDVVATYRTAVDTLRSSAKWVITSLAGVGALLVTGLGLSALSKLDSVGQQLVAVLFLLAALAGIGWAIYQTAAVLRPSEVTLADIVAWEQRSHTAPKYAQNLLKGKETLLLGAADTFEGLQTQYHTTRGNRTKALKEYYDNPTNNEKATKARTAEALAQLYTQIVQLIVGRAAYDQVHSRLSTIRQLFAGAIVALGVAGFAVTVAWPKQPDVPADFHGAMLRGVNLDGTSLVKASFSGMRLTDVRLEGADLRKADFKKAVLTRVKLKGAHTDGAEFDGARWRNVVCPDGTNSNLSGRRCSGHLNEGN